LPHTPQLALLLVVSTHVPEQLVGALGGHVHRPEAQTVPPAPHDVPQAPQFALSVCGSTHEPVQRIRGAMHTGEHTLALQKSPEGQAVVHMPQ
jgi:hypothetical protein